jgi:predicted nucleotidyltransferase
MSHAETPSDARIIGQTTQAQLLAVVARQPYPLLFVTLSGAHLYGFPSADSDYDLRGVHVLPLRQVIGLQTGRETIERSEVCNGMPIDLVTHDVKKFFLLLLKKNGYVLEQLCSPLVVQTTPVHAELKIIAQGCMTRYHAYHYLGLARSQWQLFEKESRVKPLLYVYRALLTGLHLMRTGEVEANLLRLNDVFRLPFLDELIACKQAGAEQAVLPAGKTSGHQQEYARLRAALEVACQTSHLPPAPSANVALHELLVRLRLES